MASGSAFERHYAALTSGCAVVELGGWSSVTLTGADRQKFLHNFCTNDVNRLRPGESCEAFVTNVKGKIVGHGLITCGENELVFVCVPGQAARLVEHLDRYVIREDVRLRDSTAERRFVLVVGGDSSGGTAAFSWNLVGRDGSMLRETTPPELASLLESLADRGFVRAGSEAFEAVRIEAGVPLLGIDFDEQNFPQEVGRDREAISFTKGCYLGQETVARIDALGHVNQQLAGVRFDGEKVPAAGTSLCYAEKPVGRVTSAAFSPRMNRPLAIAMVRREANALGTRLTWAAGAGEVVPLPLKST